MALHREWMLVEKRALILVEQYNVFARPEMRMEHVRAAFKSTEVVLATVD